MDAEETQTPTPQVSPPAAVTVPPVLEGQRASPSSRLARGALVLLFLYLVFGVVIPSFADYSDVWDALTSLSLGALALLTALTLVVECCKAGGTRS